MLIARPSKRVTPLVQHTSPNPTAATWSYSFGAGWEFDVVQWTRNTDHGVFSNQDDTSGPACILPAPFRAGNLNNFCSFNNFWSHHVGGVNFANADGSVRFLTYGGGSVVTNGKPLIVSLSTRAGGESASVE